MWKRQITRSIMCTLGMIGAPIPALAAFIWPSNQLYQYARKAVWRSRQLAPPQSWAPESQNPLLKFIVFNVFLLLLDLLCTPDLYTWIERADHGLSNAVPTMCQLYLVHKLAPVDWISSNLFGTEGVVYLTNKIQEHESFMFPVFSFVPEKQWSFQFNCLPVFWFEPENRKQKVKFPWKQWSFHLFGTLACRNK